ncbi:MAG: DNA-binding response regulator [Firmicutes bacterium HGW-Firmicutes-1]|jgi:DNA-binding NarL/FixJ family response regulator|nr:MAG: DNA-binding response regulator [Firmicutes bacterium HGW-Firmicutes-1]
MIKAMVVDDQVLLKETLIFMLSQDLEITVFDGGCNGYEALEACKRIRPDIILMDIRMPKLDGIGATKKIKEQYPHTKVIILTTFEDEDSIFEAMEKGADGYLVKDIKPEALVLAVKSVVHDLYVMHKSVISSLRSGVKQTITEKNTIATAIESYHLSCKDISIIKQVVDGKSNKEIAEDLNFTEGTVKNKVSKLLEKLEIKDRTQLVIFAIKNNLS